MPKTSAMQRYADQYAQRKADIAQRLALQYAIDTLQIAMHQQYGWGYDRIMRLCDAWRDVRQEYMAAVNPSNPEADVMQEHMDRVMAQIISGRQPLLPFAERYPEIRQVTYGGRKR